MDYGLRTTDCWGIRHGLQIACGLDIKSGLRYKTRTGFKILRTALADISRVT